MTARSAQPDGAVLRIGVDQAIPGGAAWGYVAQLRDVTEGRAPADRDSRNGLIIPVGTDVPPTSANVRPGRYLIEAYSPSGSTLDAEVEVGAGETAVVRLRGDSSQDWLAWQTMSGNLERLQAASPALGVVKAAEHASRWIWRLALSGALGLLVLVAWQLMNAVRAVRPLADQRLAAHHVSSLIAQPAQLGETLSVPVYGAAALAAAAIVALAYGLRQVIHQLYVRVTPVRLGRGIDIVVGGDAPAPAAPPPAPAAPASTVPGLAEPPAPLDVVLVRTPHGRSEWDAIMAAQEDARRFSAPFTEKPPVALVPTAHDDTWRTFTIEVREPYPAPAAWVLDITEGARGGLAKLPAPWPFVYDGQEPAPQSTWAPVDVLAPVAAEAAGRIAVTVRDPRFATLLGYLAGGRLTEAEVIVAKADEALFEKMENPHAAAAGGYVRLATATSFEDPDAPWRQWLANLDTFFDWLPDGAVLHAVSLIQTGRPGARERLLAAFERGVPVYTEGLRRLRDGLTFVLEDDPDGQAKAAYDIVNVIAGRCDPQQAFTCLRLGR